MSDIFADYETALERLIINEPIRVPPGTKVSKKNVALEAGRKPGSIRSDRACFDHLNAKIEAGKKKQKEFFATAAAAAPVKIDTTINKNNKFLYQQSLARELMLIRQIDNLERSLQELGNVKPFKPKVR